MIFAKDTVGQRFRASELSIKEGRETNLFAICCEERVLWVNGIALRVDGHPRYKHYRHQPGSICVQNELETKEHYEGKLAVEDLIRRTGFGTVTVEYPVEGLIADVFWERPGMRNLAIEVQATNYSTQ